MRERSGDARRERGARQPRCHLRRGCPNVRPGTRRAGGSGVASKRASVARRRCAPDRTRDALARPDAPRATDGGAPSSGRNGLHRGCWPCLAELQICPARTLNKSDRQDVDRDVPNCTRGCRGYRSARAIREMDRGGAASGSVCSIAPRPPPGRHPGRSAHASWREALDRIRLSRSATVEPPSRARPAPFCVADGIVSERDPFSRIR